MRDDSSDILIGSLQDESSAVCKESARLLLKQGITFTCNELLSVAEQSGKKHTLDTCLSISRTINKWERLLFIASLFDEKYKNWFRDADQLGNAIRQWDFEFNRSYTQPSEDQLQLLGEMFGYVKELKANQSVAFTLKSYGL